MISVTGIDPEQRRTVRGGFPPIPALLILWTFLLVTLGVAFLSPFPSPYDELEHYSVIFSQFQSPSIFPDYASYRILRPDDLHAWSSLGNYINHPSLYYLILSPIINLHHNIILLRVLNSLMMTLSLVIIIFSGCRILSSSCDRAIFAAMAVCFPKYALIGGMINNDNFAMLPAALVFAGLLNPASAGWLLAAGLAFAGWSKLTTLIALAAVIGADRLAHAICRRETPFNALNARLLAAALVGSLPYLVNLARSGHLLYVNSAIYGAPLGTRPILDFTQFAATFFGTMIEKWPAAEGGLPFAVTILTLVLPLALAAAGTAGRSPIVRLGIAYAVGLIVTLAVHLGFGWNAFQTLGDLTIAQTRYYGVLWPGFAMAGTIGLKRLTDRRAWLRWPAILLYLLPTVPGGVVLALL